MISGFCACESLEEVVFAPMSQMKSISGFNWCSSLATIKIPEDVESIDGFNYDPDDDDNQRCLDCDDFEDLTLDRKSLRDVTFAPNAKLRVIRGFRECELLERIEVPASVEVISSGAFGHCKSLIDIVFPLASRLKVMQGFEHCKRLQELENVPIVAMSGLARSRIFVRNSQDRLAANRRRLHVFLTGKRVVGAGIPTKRDHPGSRSPLASRALINIVKKTLTLGDDISHGIMQSDAESDMNESDSPTDSDSEMASP
jgi:CheY-like chemotaxis protein